MLGGLFKAMSIPKGSIRATPLIRKQSKKVNMPAFRDGQVLRIVEQHTYRHYRIEMYITKYIVLFTCQGRAKTLQDLTVGSLFNV